ncbi:MAG: hypothetical protein ABIE70_08245 [bacterium]
MHYLIDKQPLAALAAVAILILVTSVCGRRPEIIKTQLHSEVPYRAAIEETASERLSDGVAYFRAGEYELARDHLVKASELTPSDWMAYYYLGLVEMSLLNLSAAESSLHQALTLVPNEIRTRSRIYVALGQLAEVMGRPGQAQLNYRMALNLWPQSAGARSGLDRLQLRSDGSDN